MIRTQVQIPDELYERAKQFSRDREMSLAEVVRRALEQMLERYPTAPVPLGEWVLPTFDGGRTLVPLDQLKEIAYEEESLRSLRRSADEK